MTYEQIKQVNSEIKMTPIKNKEYAEVPQRVQAFRKLFPNGTIMTELLSNENGVCVFRAAVFDEADNLLASGHAYEKEGSNFINQTSYIENCETSAVGRALGFLGIGSEESMASFEEVSNAKLNQKTKEAEKAVELYNDKPVTPKMVKEINDELERTGKGLEPTLALFGVDNITKLNQRQYKQIIDNLKKKPDKE